MNELLHWPKAKINKMEGMPLHHRIGWGITLLGYTVMVSILVVVFTPIVWLYRKVI